MKKALLLFVAFLLPVLIYLFLKSFGKNEFDVPVLFADSVSAPASCSDIQYKTPYQVSDSIVRTFQWDSTSAFTVIVFGSYSKEEQHERSIQVARLMTEFKDEALGIVQISGENMERVYGEEKIVVRHVIMRDSSVSRMRNCVFFLNNTQDAVVLDKERRIRGQYTLTKREDADRLIMEELNILFKRY